MSLPVVMGIPLGNDREKSIDRARQGIADTAAMCSALGVFLAAAFPHAVEQASNFEHCLERYLNHNQKEYLEQLQTAPPMPPGYSLDPTEQLVYLCKRRDTLQSQLDGFEEMLGSLRGKLGEEGQGIMRAQIGLSGIPQQLEDLNEQIWNLQRHMEAQAK